MLGLWAQAVTVLEAGPLEPRLDRSQAFQAGWPLRQIAGKSDLGRIGRPERDAGETLKNALNPQAGRKQLWIFSEFQRFLTSFPANQPVCQSFPRRERSSDFELSSIVKPDTDRHMHSLEHFFCKCRSKRKETRSAQLFTRACFKNGLERKRELLLGG